MADKNNKNAFLLYYDWETLFDSLDSNEEAGELIRALFAFAKRGEITEFSGALKMAFIFMSQQLVKDSEKWNEVRDKRRIAINKRWNKEGNTNEYNSIQMNTNEYNSIQNIQENTNDTVNVNVNDNVNVNVNVNDKPNKVTLKTIVDNYTNNRALIDTLIDFIQHRQKLKAPLTDRALKICLSKLDSYADTDEKKVAVIEQSIERGWKGIFPLNEQPKLKEEKKDNTDLSEYNSVINKFLY